MATCDAFFLLFVSCFDFRAAGGVGSTVLLDLGVASVSRTVDVADFDLTSALLSPPFDAASTRCGLRASSLGSFAWQTFTGFASLCFCKLCLGSGRGLLSWVVFVGVLSSSFVVDVGGRGRIWSDCEFLGVTSRSLEDWPGRDFGVRSFPF